MKNEKEMIGNSERQRKKKEKQQTNKCKKNKMAATMLTRSGLSFFTFTYI